MGTNMLIPAAAAAPLTSVATPNRNLSTDPERMAVIKVWNSMMRGARKYCEEQGFVTVHNVPYAVGMTGACENTNPLFTVDWHDGKKMTKRPFLPGASISGLYRGLWESASH